MLKRFWNKFDKKENGCWEWNGSLNKKINGYGNFYYNHKPILSHRFSYTFYNGDIPNNMKVCHKCDNPSCVNPEHLFLGTQSDNIVDSIKKGRFPQSGKNGGGKKLRKLTDKQIIKIKNDLKNGVYQKDIAKKYNVTQTTICSINIGKYY